MAIEAAAKEEAQRLKEQLAGLRTALRPALEGLALLPFDTALAGLLREAAEDLRRCLERLALPVEVRTLDGKGCTVEYVRPAVDTAYGLKQKVEEQLGICSYQQQLVPVRGTALLQNKDLLIDHDLTGGVSLVRLPVVVPNEVLRLTFADPENLAVDEITREAGKFSDPKLAVPVDRYGCRGARISHSCALRFPQPVVLGEEWTVAVWICGTPRGKQSSRGLHDERITLAIREGQWIGADNGERSGHNPMHSRFLCFDFEFLPRGWHHLVAVGAGRATDYFLDGAPIGRVAWQSRGPVHAVGNAPGTQCAKAFWEMSDFRIFASAATPEQVRSLAGLT